MKIGMATAELAPFAKTGGLGDVSAALARYLARQGHDVRLFLPYYSRIDLGDEPVHLVDYLRDVPLRLGAHSYRFNVFTTRLPGSELWIYLVDCPALYHRPGLYTGDPDEHRRFLLLSRAAIESFQHMGWAPDVVHVHDWHTALVPLYLQTVYSWDRLFAATRTVLTIHNVAYQGIFPSAIAGDLDLGPHGYRLHQDDLAAGRINFLKHGILGADALTTVSRTHAREIQTDEYGFGLQGLLRARADRLVGIVNGVDYADWSPETDPLIPHHYSAGDLAGKAAVKRYLLEELRLAYRAEAPLLGVVSRFVYQKGFDLAYEPLTELLTGTDLRLVALGSGERSVEDYFRWLQWRFPERVCYVNAYSNRTAHLIEAAADLFLMPSRYEPCGLNQMYSLRYGTVPIVRKTGGLADTVEPWDPATGKGTGFVFEHANPQGVRWALRTALAAYRDRDAWARLVQNGMTQDFSWERQGALYEELYGRLIG